MTYMIREMNYYTSFVPGHKLSVTWSKCMEIQPKRCPC